MDTNKIIFPEDFVWGTATASYQIEGAVDKDGRGKSIWDTFSHKNGNIVNNENGDVSIDHYNNYKEDIALMKELNIKSYRFSVAWPRIFPDGKGEKNNKGIDFYKKLVDQLINAGIKPMATLYHWDLPQKLQDIGGWENNDTVKYFEEYADLVFNELGDKISFWITHNEPWVAAFVGNQLGIHAPGKKDWNIALKVAHNLLLSHGKVVKNYKELNYKGKIGIALNLHTIYPESENEKDKLAAKNLDGYINRWFLDPVLKGEYPQDIFQQYDKLFDLSFIFQNDLKTISTPMDFLGINYYIRNVAGYSETNILNYKIIDIKNVEKTEMNWEVYPKGLYDLLLRIKKDYKKIDIYITENGAAFKDKIDTDGKINDVERVNYLKTHINELYKAIESGAPIKGYFLWSFFDNFEWSFGYAKRFGIVYVDYNTLERKIKNSGYWYQNVIKNNGLIK